MDQEHFDCCCVERGDLPHGPADLCVPCEAFGLPLAFLIRAPSISGARAGKGLLVRCMFNIAFGYRPHSIHPGMDEKENEKRIATELIQSTPAVFLDNFNNYVMKSNALASCLSEVPARIRTFGKLKAVNVTPSQVLVLTGNGVTLSRTTPAGGFLSSLIRRLNFLKTGSSPDGGQVCGSYPPKAQGTARCHPDHLALGPDLPRD